MAESLKFETVQVENPDELNLIFGQSHFIKTCEDIYEMLIQTSPNIKFGLAFCEASGPRLIRTQGNDDGLIELATKNAQKIGCGHSFIIFLKEVFPINVLQQLKMVPEIVNIYAATANPLQVVVGCTDLGRGVMGVIDGQSPLGVEGENDKKERYELLRKFGYKLGN